MKISTDKITTYAGLASGILLLIAQSNAVDHNTSLVLTGVATASQGVWGYFTNKSRA